MDLQAVRMYRQSLMKNELKKWKSFTQSSVMQKRLTEHNFQLQSIRLLDHFWAKWRSALSLKYAIVSNNANV